MEYRLFICGNDETICDGYTDDRSHGRKDDIGTAYVEAAARKIEQHLRYGDGLDFEVGRNFHDWHGGRFYQFYDRCGLIAVERNAPKWLADLAWAADEAGSAARDKLVSELEAEADQFAAENPSE